MLGADLHHADEIFLLAMGKKKKYKTAAWRCSYKRFSVVYLQINYLQKD